MRRTLLLALAAVSLVGCRQAASLLGEPQDTTFVPPVVPAGFVGESTMLACKMHTTEECMRVGVVTNGEIVERMRNEAGWSMIVESECRDGHCYAKDEAGVEWKLEP